MPAKTPRVRPRSSQTVQTAATQQLAEQQGAAQRVAQQQLRPHRQQPAPAPPPRLCCAGALRSGSWTRSAASKAAGPSPGSESGQPAWQRQHPGPSTKPFTGF
jgi:hypothetical protein